jgi:ribonuclease HI
MKRMKKVYAVRIGRKPGIYSTWNECKAQTMGFPGAKFKGFESMDAALEFMGATQKEKPKAEAVAYVDGSYYKGRGAYGVVLFHNDTEIALSGLVSDPAFNSMNNVGGEVKGSEAAITYCISHGIKSLEIVHDYEGVASWATGDWKTNLAGTKAYKAFCDQAREKLDFSFRKVKSHSGDKLNDKADMLAKRQLGL